MTDNFKSPLVAARKVLLEIEAERARQITDEGWTKEHDDQHDAGEMALAAMCYAASAAEEHTPPEVLLFWPWAHGWWKPTNSRRDLIKAAALIVAEIERLERTALEQQENDDE